VSGFRVVGDGEREEGRAGRGAQFPDWLVAMRVETAAFSRGESWIFDPESEFAVGANGSNKVRMDGGWEPLDLMFQLAANLEVQA
jgi:hypothetical protein